jgi:cell division septation protein DedD
VRPARPGRARGGSRWRPLPVALALLSVLALTFLGGVLVGRQGERGSAPSVARESPRKPPAQGRRALSEPATVEPPPVQEKLTFYETLTAPLAAPPARPEPPRSADREREGGAAERPRPELPPRPATKAEPPPASPAPVASEPAPEGERPWTVQVAAFRVPGAAEDAARRLRSAGFDAYVVSGEGADGAPTYRVRVGRYQSRAEAREVAEHLRGGRGLAPFVTLR